MAHQFLPKKGTEVNGKGVLMHFLKSLRNLLKLLETLEEVGAIAICPIFKSQTFTKRLASIALLCSMAITTPFSFIL